MTAASFAISILRLYISNLNLLMIIRVFIDGCISSAGQTSIYFHLLDTLRFYHYHDIISIHNEVI